MDSKTVLLMLPTASVEARGQTSHACLTILQTEIFWRKNTPGTDEATLRRKTQKATEKRNNLPFPEQVQRCTQAKAGSQQWMNS